jgi:hypothetical protein
MKLVRLIKMCLNEVYGKVCIGKYLFDNSPTQDGLKQGDAFITIDFQLCFRMCHYEVPRKPGGTEIKWDTSAVVLCW